MVDLSNRNESGKDSAETMTKVEETKLDSNSNAENDDDLATKRALTEEQMNRIVEEIRESQPLTSELLPMDRFLETFCGDSSLSLSSGTPNEWREGATYLAGKYSSMRAVRGDGNCYYRAFLYATCETVCNGLLGSSSSSCSSSKSVAAGELDRMLGLAERSLDVLVRDFGYERTALELFYDEFVDLFRTLRTFSTTAPNDLKSKLHALLTEEGGVSDYCTWYLRVLTSCYIQSDPDRFLCFLLGDESATTNGEVYTDVATYCSREVEPMGVECSMVQVAALAECLGVRVRIEYFDGRAPTGGSLSNHEFGPLPASEFTPSFVRKPVTSSSTTTTTTSTTADGDDHTTISLLYRPGHYDILYP